MFGSDAFINRWAMKKGPWLFRVFLGDQKLPSYMGIIINHYKDPYKPTSIMESRRVFFVAQMGFPWPSNTPIFAAKQGLSWRIFFSITWANLQVHRPGSTRFRQPQAKVFNPQGFLGGGFKYFLFSPLFREDFQFD